MVATVPELQRRLLYALLQPAMALARRFDVPLDVVEQLARLAYFDALRSAGATHAEVANVFGKSLRTVVNLEREYRSDFLAPEAELRLHRQLEAALDRGAQTVGELAVACDADEVETRRALEALVRAGRAELQTDESGVRFRRRERFLSLVRSDVVARVDGLRHQLEVVGATVHRRFFDAGDPRPSMARTLAFLGRASDVQAMADELIARLRASAVDVEERALAEGGHDAYAVTIALGPSKPLTPTDDPTPRRTS